MVEGCLRQSVAHTEVFTVHRVTARYCFLLIVVICGLSVSSAVTANDIATLKVEAERGDSEAQALLGDRFWFGIGIASDSRKAVKRYRKAAEQGLSRAQCNLGVMYQLGEGVSRDPIKAGEWYLKAAVDLPAVIYNSPYYGFETKADLFFDLRREFSNLVGFKEFGGANSLTYAAEHITSGNPDLALMVGVDTQVFHGFVRCGAVGAITGVGNALPHPVLRLIELCEQAAAGDGEARRLALELEDALSVLSKYDEAPDLVLYYKHLMSLEGNPEYEHHFNKSDALSASQRGFLEVQWKALRTWWETWPGKES
jgi:dihydrodipicolinate synthase/N-acetylneuraminate lyase